MRFTSGSALWFAEHPHARTICVTGTKGKSTVAALIAFVLCLCVLWVVLVGFFGVFLFVLFVLSLPPD